MEKYKKLVILGKLLHKVIFPVSEIQNDYYKYCQKSLKHNQLKLLYNPQNGQQSEINHIKIGF